MPGTARFFTAGRGITGPEPGRTTAPYWVTTAAEARTAVQENAARKVDIIKIWVDDRMGTVKKLSPELYGAVIDEAHRHGMRVIAHIYTLDDAKATLRAGLDAFAHGVRDKDLDEEFMALVKQRPQLVLGPNMPDRGVAADIEWLRSRLPASEFDALQKNNTNRPDAQAFWGIQARNLAKMSAAGVRIVLGTDGNTPYAAHVEMLDMVTAGMTPMQVIVAATRNGAQFLKLADAGTIEANKSADFLVLDASPLDDITNTRRIASRVPARSPASLISIASIPGNGSNFRAPVLARKLSRRSGGAAEADYCEPAGQRARPIADILLAALRERRQYLARRRFRDQPVRILWQQKPIGDRLLRGAPDDTEIAFLGSVALLERQARIVVREPLGFRARERHVTTRESAALAGEKACADDIPSQVSAERGLIQD